MDGAELIEWWVYESLEPFGDLRADLRSGIMTSALINIQLDRKSQRTKPSDFIPDFFKPIVSPKKQSSAHMLAILRRGTQAIQGGSD